LIKISLQNGININSLDDVGVFNALYYVKNDINMINFLISKNININHCTYLTKNNILNFRNFSEDVIEIFIINGFKYYNETKNGKLVYNKLNLKKQIIFNKFSEKYIGNIIFKFLYYKINTL
jgi:hypothetical protein